MLPARHSSTQVSSVITITGLGDHDQPVWLITMTGIRSYQSFADAVRDHVAAAPRPKPLHADRPGTTG
jgi:hypothetical protein